MSEVYLVQNEFGNYHAIYSSETIARSVAAKASSGHRAGYIVSVCEVDPDDGALGRVVIAAYRDGDEETITKHTLLQSGASYGETG